MASKTQSVALKIQFMALWIEVVALKTEFAARKTEFDARQIEFNAPKTPFFVTEPAPGRALAPGAGLQAEGLAAISRGLKRSDTPGDRQNHAGKMMKS